MPRVLSESKIDVVQMIEQAKRSAAPVEAPVRDAKMVVLVLPQRDYDRWRILQKINRGSNAQPRKTRVEYLAETKRNLRQYEKKYKMTSAEFYRRFQSGKLGEDELDYFDWRVEYNAYLNLTKRTAHGKR